MDTQPLMLGSYPRAIVHIDGDAFFASCEQARDPKLKGRPVVTGKERGIAASMSYEAKARGVVRGIRISDIKRVCPEVVLLPSDYETYSLLSQRFYAIVRRFTPDVEEYIDLQKMNWKSRAGFQEHTGVSLKEHLPEHPIGGYTRVHQDTAEPRHRQRPPQPSAARLSAR